jgi:hypothetical protein
VAVGSYAQAQDLVVIAITAQVMTVKTQTA